MSEDIYKRLNQYLDRDKSEEGLRYFLRDMKWDELVEFLMTGDGIGVERKKMVMEAIRYHSMAR